MLPASPIFQQPRRWRTSHVIVGFIVVAFGAFWVIQTIRRGAFSADPSAVTFIRYARPADGERDVLPNVFVSAFLNPGHALDAESIDAETVRLARYLDGRPIPAQLNTSAAGDSIVLTPLIALESSTRYIFSVKGVKDSTGVELLPFTSTFTTGSGATATTSPVAFSRIDLPSEPFHYTCLAIGPAGRLFAGTVDGQILRRSIEDDGTLGPSHVISAVRDANGGPRLITGICFDPKSTPEAPILWISHGQFIANKRGEAASAGAQEWTGKISTLSGPQLSDYRDIIVGLPRSAGDHLNNQPAFGPDGCLYFSQGSHTAMGSPDTKWGRERVERMLSAAVLRLDPSMLRGETPLDVKTPDGGGTYDPAEAGAPLTLFATGVRVGFDMLFCSNGHLYTAANGSAAGGNTPSSNSIIALKDVNETQPDLLLRLERGGYYGHPNPIRHEYVLSGGNPTAGRDPLEVPGYPVGTAPESNWRKPAYSFGTSVSPNGIIEYQSNGKLFGGELDGKLLVTRFSGGKDIIVLSLDAKGDVVETITGIPGLTQFTDPLDLVQDPRTGCIYVAEYAGERLTLLQPITDAAKIADLHPRIFRQQVRASTAE